MLEFQFIARSNFTFDLKELIKGKITMQELAKKLKITRQQLSNLFKTPENISYSRLEQICLICGYKLRLELDKI